MNREQNTATIEINVGRKANLLCTNTLSFFQVPIFVEGFVYVTLRNISKMSEKKSLTHGTTPP